MLIARVNSSRNAEYQAVFEDTAMNYFFRPENLIKRTVENSKKRASCIPSPLVMSVGPVKIQMSECLVLYKRSRILPLR